MVLKRSFVKYSKCYKHGKAFQNFVFCIFRGCGSTIWGKSYNSNIFEKTLIR